ncbi:histone-lysine N-methyltransferase SETMAR [Trichonephila clavipes]|nr:histone-lysine N-methyltransferase SETMAR [Trichonephila clavipes]
MGNPKKSETLVPTCLKSRSLAKRTLNIVKQFLAKKGLEQIKHPPYSPDLNPSGFFLLPQFKLNLKGKRLDDLPDTNETRRDSIPNEDFLQSFQDMYVGT